MISLSNLNYVYKKGAVAIKNANGSIGAGIYLLLGENGAGKTTLMHLISGLLCPTSGSCDLDGEAPSQRKPSVMRRIFFLGDNMGFPARSINEMVKIHAVFYPNFDAALLKEYLGRFGMTGDEHIDKLSLGNRHKAQTAYALALNAEVTLLDEPANGLDITARQQLQTLLAESDNEKRTVIISTHTVSDFEALFDGIIMMHKGELFFALTCEAIMSKLAFVSSDTPPIVTPLYSERRINTFNYIIPADGEYYSDLDYLLLYNAMMSPESTKILSILNS